MSNELNLNTTPELTFEPTAAQAVEAPALPAVWPTAWKVCTVAPEASAVWIAAP